MINYEANSFQELYDIVCTIKGACFINDAEIWFRGQGRSIFGLEPSLFRVSNGVAREKEIYDTYVKLADRIGFDKKDDWHNLVNMQHHGIPTRLLDWTDNLGVALYFAVTSRVEDYSMSLFVMDPRKLNVLSNIDDIPDFPNNSMGLSYLGNYVNRPPLLYSIAIKCNYINERIWAQHGMFSLHGSRNGTGIITAAELDEIDVYKIDILSSAVSSITNYFEVSGINHHTLFPDIQGIARYINGLLI